MRFLWTADRWRRASWARCRRATWPTTAGPSATRHPSGLIPNVCPATLEYDDIDTILQGRTLNTTVARERTLDLITMGRTIVDIYGDQVGARLEEVSSFSRYVGG